METQATKFSITETGARKWCAESSWDGVFKTQKAIAGLNVVTLESTKSAIVSRLSSRHFVLQGTCEGEIVFLGYGFRIKARSTGVRVGTLYYAADEMGADEADQIHAVLQGCSTEQLFAHKSFVLLAAWEARDPTNGGQILTAACRLMDTRTVCLNCEPPDFDEPPRPKSSAKVHQRYREALDQALSNGRRSAGILKSAGIHTVLFSKQFSRSAEQQLVALLAQPR